MRFEPTAVDGAWVVTPVPSRDERGFFARTFDLDAMCARGLATDISQCSISRNTHAGTLRGLHYQTSPDEESKYVTCTRGAVFDVIVDLRPDSPSYLAWAGVRLDEETRTVLYVPPGVAHGFLTLTGDCDVDYRIAGDHAPDSARGVRWNDPAFGIDWPAEPQVIAARDRDYPDFVA